MRLCWCYCIAYPADTRKREMESTRAKQGAFALPIRHSSSVDLFLDGNCVATQLSQSVRETSHRRRWHSLCAPFERFFLFSHTHCPSDDKCKVCSYFMASSSLLSIWWGVFCNHDDDKGMNIYSLERISQVIKTTTTVQESTVPIQGEKSLAILRYDSQDERPWCGLSLRHYVFNSMSILVRVHCLSRTLLFLVFHTIRLNLHSKRNLWLASPKCKFVNNAD